MLSSQHFSFTMNTKCVKTKKFILQRSNYAFSSTNVHWGHPIHFLELQATGKKVYLC
uniref:Uncharacterized protein n=1 Tax=Rhizophora mucronata TaxID=61149 RepID=A0A2P2NYJ8_RHIMU